jgi:hypothetical protein
MEEAMRNSRDFTKSAKTVMKRFTGNYPGGAVPKVFDFVADPVSLGVRPSTAI